MPDKVYKERKAGQGIIVYGWCPAKNKAIAMQVDENGRLVIDPEDLDTRYLKLDGTNQMLADLNVMENKILLGSASLIKERPAPFPIEIWLRNRADDAFFPLRCATTYVTGAVYTSYGIRSDAPIAGHNLVLEVGSGSYSTVARAIAAATSYFEILQSGSLIPHTTKNPSLGSVTKYWNQAFIDAIICSNSIDMDPTAGDAVIYFNHDGAANEASLHYDKVNKRLELWIDGAIVGYCNAALGWVNGAP